MNKAGYELSAQTKDTLLRQLRAAVFYQVELWNTARLIEDTLHACQEGNWDAIFRLGQVRGELGEAIVNDDDVEEFTAGLEQPFCAVLKEEQKAALRQQLQKALWIQNELWRAAALIARTLGEPVDETVRNVAELSIVADSGCELVESDLDFFMGTVPSGTVKQGHTLYL